MAGQIYRKNTPAFSERHKISQVGGILLAKICVFKLKPEVCEQQLNLGPEAGSLWHKRARAAHSSLSEALDQ